MNIFKRIWTEMNETALMLHEIACGTYEEPLGPDTRQACRHCGQNVSDRNINHASTGCTVKVREL